MNKIEAIKAMLDGELVKSALLPSTTELIWEYYDGAFSKEERSLIFPLCRQKNIAYTKNQNLRLKNGCGSFIVSQ